MVICWVTYFVDLKMPSRRTKRREFLPEKDLGLRIGSAYVDAGEVETGIARIEKSIQRRPTAHGYCFLADAQIKREEFDAAQKACECAIALEPSYEEAYFLYGEAVRDHSRPEAITWYRKAFFWGGS